MLHRGKKSKGGKCYPSANFEPSPQLSWDYFVLWDEKIKYRVKFILQVLNFVRIVGGFAGEYEGYAIFF